ncbi:hypothetical protein DFQ26_005564 [Actinomortierella ambigua]|nr:hypothetical protein DFQ26_005564 [Actinomortierella ambigua]
MAPSPSFDDAGSSPESNSLASTFGSSSLDLGMASVNGSLNTFESRSRQHLAAPLPIRQRSLPDIFRLGPCSGSFASTSANDTSGLGTNSTSTGQIPPPSFYPAGSKALLLGVHFDHDGAQSSPIKLHSIPERFHPQPSAAAQLSNNQHQHQQHQYQQQYTLERGISHYNGPLSGNAGFLGTGETVLGDFGSDEEGDLKTDLGYLPSSLSELLNNGDRQPQRELGENANTAQPTDVLPSPASTLREDKDEEGGGHDRSVSSATTLGTSRDPLEAFRTRFQTSMDDLHREARHEHNSLNRVTEGELEFSVYKGVDGASLVSHAVYEVNNNDSKSSAMTSFHPLSSQFNGLLYDEYGRLDQPQFHQHQTLFSAPMQAYGDLKNSSSLETANTTSRAGTPDPFCPFPQEADEVQFTMDDDLPVVTGSTTDNLRTKPLGLGLYGESAMSSPPPPPPPPSHFSPPTLASYASTFQSSTSRHLGDHDKPTKHEEQGERTADKQDVHSNLVALMNSLDMTENGIYSM